jgi:outer membrane receptor protein involved in Fe transport
MNIWPAARVDYCHFSRRVQPRALLLTAVLAAASWASAARAAEAAAEAPADTGGLEEITVTAEKYSSTIQNTPFSVSAVSGDQLAAAGITSVEELAHELPGLSMRSAGPGQTEYEARGLASNGGAAPTVGFYLDEVPLSPPALSQAGKVVIDPNLYDVSRIEVLRGPQGTLYGSGSMGGTVKVVTNQPKLDTWEASFQGTLSDTQGGSGNGGGNFMLNIPVGDLVAVRVVGSDNYRSGWIDRITVSPFPEDTATRGNVLAGPITNIAHNANTESLYGARISVLFKPNEDFSATASAMYQRMAMGGYDQFDSPPGIADAHYQAFDNPERVDDTIHIYALTVSDNLGFADLTSATSYWEREADQTQDASESASYTAGVYPYVSLPYSENDPSQQVSQEIRLTSRGDDRLHWVLGGFYSDLHSTWNEYGANAVFAAPGNPNGIIYESVNPYWVRQYALFGDGSFKITDTLKLSAGLRWYRYLSQQLENEFGYYAASVTPAAPLLTEASNNGYNPRVNLSYSPNTDLTTYVQAAKGFRPGGANQQVPTFCGNSPTSFGPDSVWNYELGEKAKLLDNRITVNSDLYYIKWTGIQQAPLLACGYQYDTNAGNGRSFGPELEINARLFDNWVISASGAYTDAKITSPSATYTQFLLTGVPGGVSTCQTASNCTAPILNVPKDTGSLSVMYSTALFGDYQVSARVADVFVGSSVDESYYYGIKLPSYNISNARLILSQGNWSANLFVDNLTNKVALLTANNTSFQFNIPGLVRYSTNQPRTFGTQVNYKF